MTVQGSLVYLIPTVLAVPHREVLVDTRVHVHVEYPVSDVVSLIGTYQVLLWERNLSG